ncbi:hypothetical protein DL766_000382 [Monosporascus sp. MC13-8B]|uniref:Uncharacterized protein n=1 Tax=Monosporascus cannonballus TaxID=155416 RepID=A0ABY0HH17_9PEZI|nr:hypothetical protein DL762_001692 [Monosporascus cannonballus]RYO99958.1 hypothetical protein DL763_001089 [Monosporascus cannonballus]RYP39560.1 hypothetical protein DL766_000382 [Monosporascus sp. MC13-8B]
MRQKRRIDEANEQSRKRPTVRRTYNKESKTRPSTGPDEGPDESDVHQRLAGLHITAANLPFLVGTLKYAQMIGNEEYEIRIPFHCLGTFHRAAWGVKDSAKSILVRLRAFRRGDIDYVGFCVHLPPNDREFEYHHNYCTTDGPWKDFVVCNSDPNFLTDVPSRKIHKFLRLRQKGWSAREICDSITELANSDPTRSCIISVIDSFPPISTGMTISKLLELRDFGKEREALLSWLSSEFDGTLVTGPESANVSKMPGLRQFILLNTNIQRQTAFENELKGSGIKSGSPAFHGTPPENLFTILQHGLRRSQNLSTVFYSNDASYSTLYIFGRGHPQRSALGSWKNSAFKGAIALLGVEVASTTIRFRGLEHDTYQDRVMVRYVFLLAPGIFKNHNPFMGHMRINHFKDNMPTHRAEHRKRLLSGIIYSRVKRNTVLVPVGGFKGFASPPTVNHSAL